MARERCSGCITTCPECVQTIIGLTAGDVTMVNAGGSTPEQYGLPPDATELQDLIEYRKMNFASGNVFKAIYRMGTCSHSYELRDWRKIKWFADREIKRLEK